MNNSQFVNLPKDFNWKKYLEFNKDLPRNFGHLDAINHYLNFGLQENRIYKFNIPRDFDWITYLKLNPDLPGIFGEFECKEHFTKFGLKEKRKYKLETTVNRIHENKSFENLDNIQTNQNLNTNQNENKFLEKILLNLNDNKIFENFVQNFFDKKTSAETDDDFIDENESTEQSDLIQEKDLIDRNLSIKSIIEDEVKVDLVNSDEIKVDLEKYVEEECNVERVDNEKCSLEDSEKEKDCQKMFREEKGDDEKVDEEKVGEEKVGEEKGDEEKVGEEKNDIEKICKPPRKFDKFIQTIPDTKQKEKLPHTYENCNYQLFSNEDNFYDYLEEKFILNTRLFFNNVNEKYLKYKINDTDLQYLKNFILIIDFPNGGGGTTYFLNCIISKYKNYQTFVIARNYNNLLHLNINEEYEVKQKYNLNESIFFLEKYKNNISKIFINHTSSHNIYFINKLFSLNIDIFTVTHDFSLITNHYQPLYHEIKDYVIKKPPLIKPQKYTSVITQNLVNIEIFKNFYNLVNINFNIVDLPDFRKSDKLILNNNKIINIAIIGNIIEIKGKIILERIIKYYKNNPNIKIFVIGLVDIPDFNNYYVYNNIKQFNEILSKIKPHALLELSLWSETYSYTLTLAMLTNLPIFYHKKNFNSVIEKRLSLYPKSYSFNCINHLNKLIKTLKQNYFFTILPIVYYNKFWNDFFITKSNLPLYINPSQKFKCNIKPYFIYFPQFHRLLENDYNFYNAYTDIMNLQYYNLLTENKIDTPLMEYLDISQLTEYNYTNNPTIIQKQIDLLEYYNLPGFAIYYYWHSVNTFTNQNMIMEKVLEKFFDNSVNLKGRKVFFIWANENWTDNPAFTSDKNKKNLKNEEIKSKLIINNYNSVDFIENSKNLIKYFKNDNYLKINNKPVFFIYHSFLMTDKEIDNFYFILNDICIKNNFSGVHFVLNSFEKTYNKYPNFYINFNYKKNQATYIDENDNQIYLDYKNYIYNENNTKKNTIQTICFDFNNKVRLFEPNKLQHSTVCVNNSEFDKIIFMSKLINTYNKNDIFFSENKDNKNNKDNNNYELDNIILINSFNEWGENMTFEPSNKYKYYNLNLLREYLSFSN
jgi:hypothetical protein